MRTTTALVVAAAAALLAGVSAQPCASTAAGCSAYSLVETGTCEAATTALGSCTSILDEQACRDMHTLVSIAFVEGNGHMTVGASQQALAPPGCIFFASNFRHKYNANLASTAQCSSDWPCFCAGTCIPIEAHADPAAVTTTPGTIGTGGNGGTPGAGTGGTASTPAPAPCGGGGGGGGGGEGGGGGGGAGCSAGLAAAPGAALALALASLLWL